MNTLISFWESERRTTIKYYNLKPILKMNATYSMIIGERSNGKTFAVLDYALKRYCEHGEQLGLIRRWQEDFRGKRAAVMYEGLVAAGKVKEYTNGEYTNIYYYGGKWYLCRYEGEDNKRILDDVPLAYAFSLASMEHDKSTSYPNITTILFDEFLTRGMYLPDEFITFMNTLSTIIRQRDDVKIFMCANTVNKYAPYFEEMGLKNIDKMEQGKIDLYTYGNSNLSVAVEYCSNLNKEGKPSDKYFAFDNPHLKMITGGTWEIDIYPHLFQKYRPMDVIYKYYICFAGKILECEIVSTDLGTFTFIHPKTTELQDNQYDLIYCPEPSQAINHIVHINRPTSKLAKFIWLQFQTDKVCYSSNEVGEIVNNYLKWCLQ